MKRIGTVFLLFIALMGFRTQAQAQSTGKNVLPISKARMVGTVLQTPSQEVGPSPVVTPNFLSGPKGLEALTNKYDTNHEIDTNYTDTTNLNWWISGADGSFLSTIAPGGVPTTDTMYLRGLSERFTTSLKNPYLDSVQITFLAASLPAGNNLTITAVRIADAQFGNLGIFPAPDLSTSLKAISFPTDSITQQSWNTITVNFHHYKMPKPSSTVRPDFAISVNRGGSSMGTGANGYTAYDPFEDSVFFQLDANIAPYEDGINNPVVIDTTLYFTYSYSSDQYQGWYSQAFYMNNQTAADTTMAFFGNMVMKAFLDDPLVPAAVNENPTDQYRLAGNYPNPVSTTSEINYNLGISGPTTLKVYNSLGQEVSSLVNSVQGAGEHTATFSSGTLPDGMYYYKLQSGEFSATNTMVIAR
jgi:hypothetical protein